MALRLLNSSPCLQLFYDSDHDWLYLDWQGAITIADGQAGWLALTRCLLERPYACVLNSNAQVTRIAPEVTAWLLRGFERFLQLSGIQQLAWVYAPSVVHSFGLAVSLAAALPRPNLALFADEEQAVSWLEHYSLPYGCAQTPAYAFHSPKALSRLRHLAAALEGRPTGSK